ncbi:ribosomal protein L16p/L10e-domain-containing protein [Gamsiella multidivaricata]|uniref:ribosomal protein L16p/L10e-domain-containing protein n=1 Tax=Gamsiella multidivaricata TaxID=101098 RepID=UPI00221E4AB8|nr:ribosomal protein L16p/L10e-domain-containing protein [Gamsiella multidivaricata]KAI7820540.1 ribosomal protein L16p/L10e-domain-containing protein [Gamsiella multidivaricata]
MQIVNKCLLLGPQGQAAASSFTRNTRQTKVVGTASLGHTQRTLYSSQSTIPSSTKQLLPAMASLFRALSRTPLLLSAARPSTSTAIRPLSSPSLFVRNFSFGSPSAPLSIRNHGSIFPSLHSSFNMSSAVRSLATPVNKTQRRFNSLQPKKMKYRKKHKGKIPIPIGGSTKGTFVEFGEYGLRIKEGARLTAKQIQAAHTTIRRKIKAVKGSQIWTRVFPDIPVTSKGGESRMGKGKGSVDYYATRVGLNRIIFEIGGGGIRREHAKEALRLAAAKIPVAVEFVVKAEQVKPPKVPRVIPGAPVPLKALNSASATVVPITPVIAKEAEIAA